MPTTRLIDALAAVVSGNAIALYATQYNFCRVHESLRITPAMHLGITDHVWIMGELIEAALSKGPQMQVQRSLNQFRIIPGEES